MRPAIGGERRGGLDRSGHRRSCTCRGSPRRHLENRECRGRQRVDWLTHTFGNAAPRAGGENWREKRARLCRGQGFLVVDDLKKGYYLLFVDGGKRANEQGQAEGAIGVILQEPDCGAVLETVFEKVGPVGSPHEAEYHALIRGLKLAAEKRLPYIAAFSDSANVVNQITRGWNKNEQALEPFKTWLLSWVPREMNRDSDKLVDQAFRGEPVTHATD